MRRARVSLTIGILRSCAACHARDDEEVKFFPHMQALMSGVRYFRMMYERAVSDVVIVVLVTLSSHSPSRRINPPRWCMARWQTYMMPMVRVNFLSCQQCHLFYLEDEDSHAVIEHTALFTSRIAFGIPNVILFIRTVMEGSLHGHKIDNLMMKWIFIA